MTPALILFSGALVTVTAILAMLFGVSFGTAVLFYLIAGLGIPCLLIALDFIRQRKLARGARDMAEIQAEIVALRESAARDSRFGAGSPEALSPLLHRRLRRREAEEALKDQQESDFMIRSPR